MIIFANEETDPDARQNGFARLGKATWLVCSLITALLSESVTLAQNLSPTPSPVPLPGTGFCCYWAPTSDKCGTCTAFDKPPAWCAQSLTNCQVNCAGTWCPQTTSTTTAPATTTATTTSLTLTTVTQSQSSSLIATSISLSQSNSTSTQAKTTPASTSTVGTIGFCCYWAPTTDKCGTCTAFDAPPSWCALSATNCQGNCAGTWCTAMVSTSAPPGTTTAVTTTTVISTTVTTTATTPQVKTSTASTQLQTTGAQTTTTTKGTTTSTSGFCCYWAPTTDKCSTCTAFDAPPAWCAQSAANCQGNCAGTWCPQISSTTTSPITTVTTAGATTITSVVPATSTQPTATPSPTPTSSPTASMSPNNSPTPSASPSAAPSGPSWTEGTYVTGYWDCCKPSCSWPNTGNVNAPVRSCKSDGTFANPNDGSVCTGGVAASCSNNQPWVYNTTTSLGFAAAAVSGSSGLTGNANCGQCYQLVFTSQIHSNGNWGGSNPDLVGKSHIIQVTNIGYDVTGTQSFDLQIPGAGQGAFTTGCVAQYGGQSSTYDCGNNYGGCNDISGCAQLPAVLQPGCRWRYNWFDWLISNGQTNNPYVRFRRVRCPNQLTSISGSVPNDDSNYPVVIPQ